MNSRIPSDSECLELMAEIGLAPAIVNHSINVKNIALDFAEKLEKDGVKVDRLLLAAAALLHDIMKIDAEFCHGIEGGEFLRQKGFKEVASVVEKHCLSNIDKPELVPKTAEEKILMYADLRVQGGRIVSIDERFDYINTQYKPSDSKKFLDCLVFAKKLESDLFGSVDNKK